MSRLVTLDQVRPV